ncbi:MAG: hypothetical protein ACJAVK_001008 [Akkermansiaceae bacterium]|jgi:hypothetical protein
MKTFLPSLPPFDELIAFVKKTAPGFFLFASSFEASRATMRTQIGAGQSVISNMQPLGKCFVSVTQKAATGFCDIILIRVAKSQRSLFDPTERDKVAPDHRSFWPGGDWYRAAATVLHDADQECRGRLPCCCHREAQEGASHRNHQWRDLGRHRSAHSVGPNPCGRGSQRWSS